MQFTEQMKTRRVILHELESRGKSRYWLAKRVSQRENSPCGMNNVYKYLSGYTNASVPVVEAIMSELDLNLSRW